MHITHTTISTYVGRDHDVADCPPTCIVMDVARHTTRDTSVGLMNQLLHCNL